MNALDPFVVTTKEKLRFEQQFNALGPVNGIVTGGQAKGFLLKSGLSPVLLGQIWALADTDADGKMDLIEFSIACKLISLKLRNVEVPKMLPPTLISSLKHVGTPIRTPTGLMSPSEEYKQFITQPQPTAVPLQTAAVAPQPVMPQVAPVMPQVAPVIPQVAPVPVIPQAAPVIPQPALIMQQQQQLLQQQMLQQQMMAQQAAAVPVAAAPMQPAYQAYPQPQDLVHQQMMMAQQQQMSMPLAQPIVVAPVVAQQPLVDGSLLDSLTQAQPQYVPTGPLPAAPTPTPPQSGHASRSMSFSDKPPVLESP